MPNDSKISPLAVRAMIIVLVVLAFVTLFANIQRARRGTIESVTVTPMATPSPTPRP